jgi:nucleotide-binding universal stress UspA family protein
MRDDEGRSRHRVPFLRWNGMVTITRILCAIDARPSSRSVVSCACSIARACGARLEALHVVERRHEGALGLFGTTPRPVIADFRTPDEIEQLVATLLLDAPDELHRPAKLVWGRPEVAILEQARADSADLVVLGSERAASSAALRLADELSARAACPVLTVPTMTASRGPASILLPVDLSPATESAVDWAAALARRFGATVTVLHALRSPVPEWRSGLAETALGHAVVCRAEARLRAAGVQVSSRVAKNAPLDAILSQRDAEGSDFIVMGMHRPHWGRLTDAMSATAGTVASVRRRVAVPVLSVMPRETESALTLNGRWENDRARASSAALTA